MATRGTVRLWSDGEGWGVIDSPETPGGCWAGFMHVRVAGFASLQPGAEVELEWEPARQDGFDFCAVSVWPVGAEPVYKRGSSTGDAYRSSLVITQDEPGDPAVDSKHSRT